MIFITEQNLRDLYAKEAYETFTLVEGERLTPGARQFLADRQISIVDPMDAKPAKTATIQLDGSEEYTTSDEEPKQTEAEVEVEREAEKLVQNIVKSCTVVSAPASVPTGCSDKLKARFCALQALYLKQASDIYAQNQTLANEIFDMECSLCSIENGVDINILTPGSCSGMSVEDLKYPHRECFHMTRAILLANHGAEAAALHYLRGETYRFYYDNAEELSELQKVRVAYLINLFSQMIHRTIGGSLCQKTEK